jgi:DMSO/TMAO reductase YedYZ heme-binding membrane subunit
MEGIMRFIAGLVVSVLFVALFRRPVKRFPAAFYALAVVLDLVLIVGSSLHLPSWLREYFLFLLQSNNLAMGLFCIVMFTGVLKEGSGLKRALLAIRAELSIIASVLCVGHAVAYGGSYLEQLTSAATAMPAARLSATLIAFVLVLLLVPLALTSAKAVRARMALQAWKRLQRLAYPFFVLVFAHVFFYLMPPAAAGSLSALVSLVVYLAVGIAYVTLRVRLYLQADRGAAAALMPRGGLSRG